MAGENFCAESLERRRTDASVHKTIVWGLMLDAIAAADAADIQQATRNLDAAQRKIADLRDVLEDLVLERERQMDVEDEQCGA